MNRLSSVFVVFVLATSVTYVSPRMAPIDTKRELIYQVDSDSTRYDLWLEFDGNDRPLQYTAEIFTPVCYSNKCYPVFIDFYWDLLGNFDRYEMPDGKILTKLDHLPFEPADYEQMQKILRNPNSLLKNFAVEELVVGAETAESKGVDAVTGATSKTIQNEVISGAVYSCYTLWHLAHGEITDLIRTQTSERVSDALLLDFLGSKNHRYQYWAVDRVLETERAFSSPFEAPLLALLGSDNLFVAEYLLAKVPLSAWSAPKRQRLLMQTYLHRPYRLQLKVLERMKGMVLEESVVKELISQIPNSNPAQRDRIMAVVESQPKLSRATIGLLDGMAEANQLKPFWR